MHCPGCNLTHLNDQPSDRYHVETRYTATRGLANVTGFASQAAAEAWLTEWTATTDQSIDDLIAEYTDELAAALSDETVEDPISIQYRINGLRDLQALYIYEIAPCDGGDDCIACMEAGLI